jgi:hypothetical protein
MRALLDSMSPEPSARATPESEFSSEMKPETLSVVSTSKILVAAPARLAPLWNLIEAVAFAAFTAVYIWQLQNRHPQTWWILPIWLLLSFALHRDTPKTLGWRGDNLLAASRRALPFFALAVALLVGAGLFLGGWHRVPVHLFEGGRFWGYCAFCLLQQVGLNSFVTNRLFGAFRGPLPAAMLSGAIFAALHWPNPVLVPLTFVAGTAMAWLFATERNILPLTLMQAVLGALVWWAFPLAWHHGMRVGPGFYTFHHH